MAIVSKHREGNNLKAFLEAIEAINMRILKVESSNPITWYSKIKSQTTKRRNFQDKRKSNNQWDLRLQWKILSG